MAEKKAGKGLSQRQKQIVEMVRQQGFAAVEALAQNFDVTPQTIRRDINELCSQGLVRRFHGGVGLSSSVENVAYETRKVLLLEEKQRIARQVAGQIPDRASVFIDIGTSTEEVARALRDHEGLRVITNDLNVATILSGNPTCEVIIAGGVVRHRYRGITGEATIDFIRQFKVDFGILGISAIDSDGTLLEFDYHEVRVAQAIIENSRKVFLTADHTKFGRNALVRLGHLSQIDALFTDRQPPEEIAGSLAEHNVALYVAEAGLRSQ
ncbi:DeoR/GlpR family transcriptional regulator [Desulfuromonas sp.]|uniref:DeoR/GlpR family transcriptional regulator n=1 Tax=Desulfuromonas sp. TaxID=892 RepID=UPI0025BCDC1A|nr:DeoR/GlpR family transcriptional regulator [Desulfuromonas sp.]